jgi:CheY-like chemotaxis protein
MDGREMVRAMKAQPELASIPVMLLSSADRLEEEARQLGAQGALKKPIDVTAMLTAIAESRGPAHA